MNKTLLALACMAVPLAVVAANPKADPKAAPAAASAAAPAASAPDARTAVRSAQQRGSKNAACRKEAADKGLSGQAFKDAMLVCMKQDQ
jgi:hypothetical protein